MIRFSSSILKNLFVKSNILTVSNKSFFAKEPKDAKKGGKQQKKKQAAPVQQSPAEKLLPHEKLINYFAPLQSGLSPSETQALKNNFQDLSDSQKQILDNLADKIVQLNTSMFYDFTYRREALGTTQAYVVGSGHFQESQVKESIKTLRKDV